MNFPAVPVLANKAESNHTMMSHIVASDSIGGEARDSTWVKPKAIYCLESRDGRETLLIDQRKCLLDYFP